MILVNETLLNSNINTGALKDLVSIITAVLTFLIAHLMSRQAFVAWRKELSAYLFILWSLAISTYIALIIQVNIETRILLTMLIIWILIFLLVFRLLYKVLNLETIPFSKKTSLKFDKAINCPFDSGCIDEAIKEAISQRDKSDKNNKEIKSKKLYPLILVADEFWRPWQIVQKFVVNSILDSGDKTGIIYFTFTRPHNHVKSGLHRKLENKKCSLSISGELKNDLIIIDCFTPFSVLENNLIIIDCFTPLSMKVPKSYSNLMSNRLKKKQVNNGYLLADPRNPHTLNKCYEEALSSLHQKGCKSVCVIYDALSDFLCFTDEQIAIQYLRHNMYWEEEKNVSSIYILRRNTLKNAFLEEYIQWFANTVFYLEGKEGNPTLRIRGLFDEPKFYNIDYDMNIKEDASCTFYN